jgi:hypothetical protein
MSHLNRMYLSFLNYLMYLMSLNYLMYLKNRLNRM